MATDVEESDTDEKPGPAKRQRVLAVAAAAAAVVQPPPPPPPPLPPTLNGQNEAAQPQQQQQQSDPENTEAIDEEEDRRAREKLQNWQSCQMITGCMDNAINHALENFEMSSFECPSYCFYRRNRMEDTAVSMAIRKHGLVRSSDLAQLPSLVNERITNVPQNSESVQTPVASISSDTMFLTNIEASSSSSEGDRLDNTYDSDHQQDFLDRAVAEAIKKKGLSTLSVDYG